MYIIDQACHLALPGRNHTGYRFQFCEARLIRSEMRAIYICFQLMEGLHFATSRKHLMFAR